MLRVLYCLPVVISLCSVPAVAQVKDASHVSVSNYLPQIHTIKDIRKALDDSRHLQMGAEHSSLLLFLHLFKESKRLNYPFGMAASLLAQGNIYSNQSLPVAARKVDLEAVGYAMKDTGSRKLLGMAYNNAARAARDLGDLKEAAALFIKAAETTAKVPASQMAIELIYNNLGSVLEDDKMRLYYFRKAEAIAREKKDTAGIGLSLLNVSNVLDKLQDWKGSEACMTEAQQLGRAAKDTLLQRRAFIKLAMTFILSGQPERALRCLDEGERIGHDINAFYNIAPLFSRSEAYLQLKDYKNAERYCQQALESCKHYGFRELIYQGHRIMSDIYGASGQFEKAYEQLLLYQEIKDSVVSERASRNVQLLQTRYEVAQKDQSIAEKQLKITQQQRRLGRNKILILATLIGAALLSILLFFVYRNYSHKQRLLLKDQELAQLKAMIKGEEKERGRIARELHDGIGGMLVAINMNLGIIRREHPEAGLGRIEGMLDDAGREVRKTAHNLVPDVLERHDLREALALYCAKINEGGILQVLLQCDDVLPPIDPITALILYRIIQELLQNIVKHAGATQAGIHILSYEDKLAITIEDNGKGFDPAVTAGGMGLHNVQHRVHALQGEVDIASSPGRGTTVHIELLQENLAAALK